MDDLAFMQIALEMAQKAALANEVPVGAVLVKDGEIVAMGHNQPISGSDPTLHAEVVVLREYAQKIQNYRLTDTTLYVTLEPCLMCAGALVHARIKRVVFACPDPKAGAVVSIARVLEDLPLNHRVQVSQGPLEQESCALLRAFFKARRG